MFGEVPGSEEFDTEEHKASKTVEELRACAVWAMKAAAGSARPSMGPWVEKEVRKRTLEEVEEGKADGPYTEDEAAKEVSGPYVPARRVGVVQGGEVRPIDDIVNCVTT